MKNLPFSSAFCAKASSYLLLNLSLSSQLSLALRGKIPNSFRRNTTRSVLVSLALFSLSCLSAHAETYDLLLSTSSNGANSELLSGKSVAGNIYVFTSPENGVAQVQFFLDNPNMTGTPKQTESIAPYDFAGGSSTVANPFNTDTLAAGAHTITAKIFLSDGTTQVVSSAFTTASNTPPTPTPTPTPVGGLSGQVWFPLELALNCATAQENDSSPNPFLDYRLQVTFTSPNGEQIVVPGFFDGNGNGVGSGSIWKARFSPNAAGLWGYEVSFRQGTNVAIDLSTSSGSPAFCDGAKGTFNVAARDPNAPGFLKWGLLEYVGKHYLKFHDGGYFIKGGADSPENILGYKGFDNVIKNVGGAGIIHEYLPHRADFNTGDPEFVSSTTGYDSHGIIGALNYLSSQHVNSIYFLPMNLGGDAQDTTPSINYSNNSFDKTHYDISRLNQWNTVLQHAERQGIMLHFVLAETEAGNTNWFDNGTLGNERKLYFRELIARFGYILGIKWNLSEENRYPVPVLREMASYISALDYNHHPITVHTNPNDFRDYQVLVGDPRFSATAIQYSPDSAGSVVETWRTNSANAGRPWVLDMDENNPAGSGLTRTNASDLRKRVLYDVFFSGGNIEWYLGGEDQSLEDFRSREEMWRYMWYARSFMETNLPFWDMTPADSLLSGETADYGGGQVFTKQGSVYAVYFPNANQTGSLDLISESGKIFTKSWFNPRTGLFEGTTSTVDGGASLVIGTPPSKQTEDWVLLLTAVP